MQETGVIYKITNKINGKSYIGQTVDFNRRKRNHFNKKEGDKECYAIHQAFFKYGKENFSIKVIEECPKEELDEKEKYYIKYFHSHYTENGYNLTWGGDNADGLVKWIKEHPEEHKKMALKNREKAMQWREKHPEEALAISRKMQKAGIEKVKRKVHCIDLDLYFESLSAAERWSQTKDNPNGITAHHQHISKVCNGKRPHAGGYKWEYVQEKE